MWGGADYASGDHDLWKETERLGKHNFPIFLSIEILERKKLNHTEIIQKQNLSSKKIKDFKTEVSFVNWEFLNDIKNPNSAYEEFRLVFSDICNRHIPAQNVTVKLKYVVTPSISKGLKKFSKQKQELYIKFLKKKDKKIEETYKNYKSLFEISNKDKTKLLLILACAKPK